MSIKLVELYNISGTVFELSYVFNPSHKINEFKCVEVQFNTAEVLTAVFSP